MAMSADLQSFTGNGDVSIWVKKILEWDDKPQTKLVIIIQIQNTNLSYQCWC